MTSGIYFILCPDNKKMYIGSSVKLRQRLVSHRYHLRNHTHFNTKLQRAFNKYGKMSFGVIEEVLDKSKLAEREKFWIDILDSIKGGFNIARDTLCPLRGLAKSESHKRNISRALTGYIKSPEHIEKLKSIEANLIRQRPVSLVDQNGALHCEPSVRAFSRKFNICRSGVMRLLDRKAYHREGWRFPTEQTIGIKFDRRAFNSAKTLKSYGFKGSTT